MTSKSLLERHTKPEEIDLESSCPIPSVDGVIKIEWDDAPFGEFFDVEPVLVFRRIPFDRRSFDVSESGCLYQTRYYRPGTDGESYIDETYTDKEERIDPQRLLDLVARTPDSEVQGAIEKLLIEIMHEHIMPIEQCAKISPPANPYVVRYWWNERHSTDIIIHASSKEEAEVQVRNLYDSGRIDLGELTPTFEEHLNFGIYTRSICEL